MRVPHPGPSPDVGRGIAMATETEEEEGGGLRLVYVPLKKQLLMCACGRTSNGGEMWIMCTTPLDEFIRSVFADSLSSVEFTKATCPNCQ